MRTQEPGERFLEALLVRDFTAMGAHLHPRVRLRALQPGGAIVRVGAHPVVTRWADWLGGWDGLEVLDCSMSPVGPRLRMAYHLGVTADEGTREVAHQLLVDVADGQIAAIDLLSSGFMETARHGGGA